VRSISEKAPPVFARVALKNIALPRAQSSVPSPASRTVAVSRKSTSYEVKIRNSNFDPKQTVDQMDPEFKTSQAPQFGIRIVLNIVLFLSLM
jgi:hypothetical protein